MKRAMFSAIAVAVCLCGAAGICRAGAQAESFALENGIRVLSIYFPESSNVSIFTFVPMGLAGDGAGRTQWSHLVEHLVIRTTAPAGSRQANAETLGDHMRLDFYGTVDNWREGLSHHARWIEGIPFTAESLRREKRAVSQECDFVAERLFTHKFAMAAWGQGYRHGLSHAAIKADVDRAELRDIQAYRDRRLGVLDRALICVVGGIDCNALKPIISTDLGDIRSNAETGRPVKPHPGDRTITWDMKGRHLMLTWPIPACSNEDYPALMVAGRWLAMKLSSDSELKKSTGMVLADTDLVTPEGAFFCVSASLKPEASSDVVRRRIEYHLKALRSGAAPEAAMIAAQLSYQLTNIGEPKMAKAQAPPAISEAMIEGSIGLQWAMQEYRYGPQRARLAKRLATVTGRQVGRAAAKYLSAEKCSVCSIEPGQRTAETR